MYLMAAKAYLPMHVTHMPGDATFTVPLGCFAIQSADLAVHRFPFSVVYHINLASITTMSTAVACQEKYGWLWGRMRVIMACGSYTLLVIFHTPSKVSLLAQALPGRYTSLGEGPTDDSELAFGQQSVVLATGVRSD